MVYDPIYRILGVKPDAPPEKVKEAYYRAAKRNHPDLFPEPKRHAQQLRMMKINEAYLTIVSRSYRKGGDSSGEQERPAQPDKKVSDDSSALGELKDPAYAYYKLGFSYYTKGRKAFFDRYRRQKNRFHYMMGNREILILAITCIKLFEKSYSYFLRVVEDYPHSIWYRDTLIKLEHLQRYNTIYHRICAAIAAQIGKATA